MFKRLLSSALFDKLDNFDYFGVGKAHFDHCKCSQNKSLNVIKCLSFCMSTCLVTSCQNIGITHVFSCINICRVPRMLFEREADRPSVQHHPRDPASVNAMKQTCVIVILVYFTLI